MVMCTSIAALIKCCVHMYIYTRLYCVCRALYELAISQPALDMPEALWKVRRCKGRDGSYQCLVTTT